MKQLVFLLAAIAAVAGGAMAQVADGTYQIGACSPGPSDSQVTVNGTNIAFWESSCNLTNPVAVRDMPGAVLYDAICSGEGQVWTERMFLQPSPEGGFIRVNRGYATTYTRCN